MLSSAMRTALEEAVSIRYMLRALGIPVVKPTKVFGDNLLASSRMPLSIRKILEMAQLNQPIVAYNGGLILSQIHADDTQEVIFDQAIEIPAARIIESLCQELGVHCSLYHANDWFVSHDDFWSAREMKNTMLQPTDTSALKEIEENFPHIKGFHKIMCMGEADKISRLEKLLHSQCAADVDVYRTKDTYLELSPKGINKHTALMHICHYLGVSLSESIAIGDNHNDIDMVRHAGIGIAVQNAVPELKAVAKHHTSSHLEDGVALAVQRFF